MELSRTAFGTWNGGLFIRYGLALTDAEFVESIRYAYEKGIRTFVTADVYGSGRADILLGEGLKGVPRDTYCLVGMIGHDFYSGLRAGAKGYPRFTEPGLRDFSKFGSYLNEACQKSLERCQTDKFDLLMLHNPDSTGYTSPAVWDGLRALKQSHFADRLGIAPGPANGFTLDIIDCFELNGADIDWAMLILNPFEPWPGLLALPAAQKYSVKVLTRVVDYGGIFHDEVKPGLKLAEGDHRSFRPAGWVEKGYAKLNEIRPIAEKHGLTTLQLASLWNLANPPVESVVPTLFREAHVNAKTIATEIDELASLPIGNRLSGEEVRQIGEIGNNTGLMKLKGASDRHLSQEPRMDEWPTSERLLEVSARWGLGKAWPW
jgi:aryl-alcohol dehydrogenase-like predicted oxidoreductase